MNGPRVVADNGSPRSCLVSGVRLVIGIPVSDDEDDFDSVVDQDDGEPRELSFG